MSANRQLRTDFEFLKVASKRGESELLQALDNLEDARRENEALLKQYRALQAENARLRGPSAAAVNHAHYRRAVGEPQHRRAARAGCAAHAGQGAAGHLQQSRSMDRGLLFWNSSPAVAHCAWNASVAARFPRWQWKSSKHAGFIRRNTQSLRVRIDVRVQCALLAVKQLVEVKRQFDFIARSPYGDKTAPGQRSESWAQRLLDEPALPQLLAPDGRLLLGHTKRDVIQLADLGANVKPSNTGIPGSGF